jgi:hypothetical protein
VRRERGGLRVRSFGHTETYQRIVSLLQQRAVDKFKQSRSERNAEGWVHDLRRIEALLDYNQKR